MNAIDDTVNASQSYWSLPEWPKVRPGRLIALLLTVAMVVYSVGGIFVYGYGGGYGGGLSMLLIVAVGFMGVGAAAMIAGFVLRAFDASRVLGTYLVGFGACLGALGAFNLVVLMGIV